ncbi:hypothetical protein EHV15_31430 [Paenibacillus oralis]|uniref:Uncharacterized protein n=1 Tax=Paenibacillus oralis TaxID=2490856 RepID=A0A3P3U9B1_9BACL|nr:hypothetical protein [Paenibacillus oralis]RRJ66937.1 hypothetical protein EHV15_31430 [Paenibacillus oralis]
MANPITPNLGLNKIDRTSPETTYFDLEKYVDQNADKVDAFAGNVGESLNEFKERFDTADTKPVTLQPGLQVVNSPKDARFRLGEVRGRTLINLLGNAGSCDSLQSWPNTGRLSLDTANNVEGIASIKATIGDTDQYVDMYREFPYDPDKMYVAVGELKVPSGVEARIRMIELNNPSSEISSEQITSTGSNFKTVFIRIPKNAFSGSKIVYFGAVFVGNPGTGGNADALRIFEISSDEYAVLDGMKAEQVAEKYPFVSSGIHGVDGPYAIGYGENLLPPFYEYSASGASLRIIDPYESEITLATAYNSYYVDIPAIPSTTYTMSCESISGNNGEGFVNAAEYEGDTELLISNTVTRGNETITFTTSLKTNKLRIFISANVAGTYRFKKPILVIGSGPKPFKPQQKSMLAFQTELHANSVGGWEADVLFEKEGQYFKLAKWKKVVLDGSLSWNVDTGHVTSSYKPVFVRDGTISAVDYITYVTKYTGALLINRTTASYTGSDQSLMYLNGIHVSIANTDSGWGPDYFPSQDEIKAYFMGWKMYTWGASDQLYNGTGKKGWGKIYCGIGAPDGNGMIMGSGVDTLPTESNDQGYTPYQLLYRLAKETVEPVVSEGALLLSEGDNMVEVGTGIVLRELAKPMYYSPNGNYYINNTAVSGSLLKNRVSLTLRVYRNDRADNFAKIENDTNAYGKQHIRFLSSDFDPTAAYSVTYIKKDKSPIQPITGMLAANEKAQFSDLTAGVAEALQRVSVVEQKKAEEDAPGWIAPTLLNGWVAYDATTYPTAEFTKDSQGYVHLRGMITGGSIVAGTVIFRLPIGYRPKKYVMLDAACSDGDGVYPALVNVSPGGVVSLNRIWYNGFLSLFLPPFLVEQ